MANTSAQALQQLQQYNAGMLKPEQAFSKYNQSLGVNAANETVKGLRGAITNTTRLLNQVAPGVMGRTQNSLVTSAQANRQIQNEQTPIQGQLSGLNQDYGNASQDYQDLARQAEARANAELTGQQGQLSFLQQMYQNLYGKEQDARAEAARQSALRAANAGLSFGGGGGGGGSSADPIKAATGYALTQKNKLLGGGKIPTFAREGVRDDLMAQFGLSKAQADSIIYKNVFPDNWAGGGQPTNKAAQNIAKAVGIPLKPVANVKSTVPYIKPGVGRSLLF